MSRPVILLGAGGHAVVLLDALQLNGTRLLGYAAPQATQPGPLSRLDWIGDDSKVLHYPPEQVLLVNGIGSVGDTNSRRQLYEHFKSKGYQFASVFHPHAIISNLDVQLGEGVQVLAGAVINGCVSISDNVIVNTRSVVEHHCVIANHCHVASGAVICGGCHIENSVHIGAGATVNQERVIEAGSVIASGAVVISNVKENTLVAGVPAQVKKTLR
jgi:sugar O-acyltransferase (sialic acid O-acetyltransferase NeuD family)